MNGFHRPHRYNVCLYNEQLFYCISNTMHGNVLCMGDGHTHINIESHCVCIACM